MLTVQQNEREGRRDICKGCEHYHSFTDSCGTLIFAGLLDNETGVNINTGEEVTLCGCVIRIKTKFALQSCPLGKWGRTALTDEQLEEVKVIIAGLEGKKNGSDLSGADIAKVNEALKIITGFDGHCGSCAGDAAMRLRDIRSELIKMDDGKCQSPDGGIPVE